MALSDAVLAVVDDFGIGFAFGFARAVIAFGLGIDFGAWLAFAGLVESALVEQTGIGFARGPRVAGASGTDSATDTLGSKPGECIHSTSGSETCGCVHSTCCSGGVSGSKAGGVPSTFGSKPGGGKKSATRGATMGPSRRSCEYSARFTS